MRMFRYCCWHTCFRVSINTAWLTTHCVCAAIGSGIASVPRARPRVAAALVGSISKLTCL